MVVHMVAPVEVHDFFFSMSESDDADDLSYILHDLLLTPWIGLGNGQ